MPTSEAPAIPPLRTIARAAIRFSWVVALALATSLLAAEGVFRVLGTRVASTMEGFYEPFGDGSFKHKAGAQAFMNWSSGPFHVQIDQRGMRIDHRTPTEGGAAEHDALTPNILVLGNSSAFGQGLDYHQTPIGVFAILAKDAGLRVDNAAVIGHFPLNQEELLGWLLKEQSLRPRIVLVTLTPHSIGYAHDYFRSHVHHGTLFAAPPGNKELLKKWLVANSAVYVTLRDAFKHGDDKEANDVTFSLFETSSVPKHQEELTTHLHHLQNRLSDFGARIVVAYLPLASEEEIPGLARAMGFNGAVDAHAPREAARAAAVAAGIPFVDLSPAIAQCVAAGEPLTLRGDPHYGPELSKRMGERLWGTLDWRELASKTATAKEAPGP